MFFKVFATYILIQNTDVLCWYYTKVSNVCIKINLKYNTKYIKQEFKAGVFDMKKICCFSILKKLS